MTYTTVFKNLTYNDLDNDKREFYNCDARYTETTNMSENNGVIRYDKRIEMHNPEHPEKIWGCWIEIREMRTEPIFKVLSTYPNGDGIYTQTVEKIGDTIYEDTEYFCYGEGFKTFDGSRYVHAKSTHIYGEA